MNIYAIKDRLIDYYMPPFLAPSDKEALAAIANVVNDFERSHAITKTPRHFEIWRLAYIEETGEVKGPKELLADCSSLIRGDIRPGDEGRPGTRQGAIESGPRGGPPSGPGGHSSAQTPVAPGPTEATNLEAENVRPGPPGLPQHGH